MLPTHFGDDRDEPPPYRRGTGFVVGVTVFAMVIGAGMIREGLRIAEGPPQPDAAAAADAGARIPGGVNGGARMRWPSAADTLPASPPVRIRIPAIRVDAPLTGVGLAPDGWITPPPSEKTNLAGWYRGAPSPGESGTAVIVGHVDNTEGPAVFYPLGALRKGAAVEVVRGDGRTVVFTVYGNEVFSNDAFPSERVYGDTGHPELRLITCGGGYRRKTGYQGNVVVFARLTQVR